MTTEDTTVYMTPTQGPQTSADTLTEEEAERIGRQWLDDNGLLPSVECVTEGRSLWNAVKLCAAIDREHAARQQTHGFTVVDQGNGYGPLVPLSDAPAEAPAQASAATLEVTGDITREFTAKYENPTIYDAMRWVACKWQPKVSTLERERDELRHWQDDAVERAKVASSMQDAEVRRLTADLATARREAEEAREKATRIESDLHGVLMDRAAAEAHANKWAAKFHEAEAQLAARPAIADRELVVEEIARTMCDGVPGTRWVDMSGSGRDTWKAAAFAALDVALQYAGTGMPAPAQQPAAEQQDADEETRRAVIAHVLLARGTDRSERAIADSIIAAVRDSDPRLALADAIIKAEPLTLDPSNKYVTAFEQRGREALAAYHATKEKA